MTPEEIKARMKQRGLTQPGLAKRFGCSITSVHFLIHGFMTSKDLAKRLARAVGVKLSELPSRAQNGTAKQIVSQEEGQS